MSLWIWGGPDWQPTMASTMKFNAALSLFFLALASAAMLFKSRTVSRWIPAGLASLAFVLGAGSLLEYMFHLNLGMDELFVSDHRNLESLRFPGRMAPNAALCIVALSIAIAFLGRSARLNLWAQRLAVVACFTSGLALIGYLFNARGLYAYLGFIRISPYTALSAFLLSVSILFYRPQVGVLPVILSRSPSGHFLRRMLLAVLIGPPLVGWLGNRAESLGIFAPSTAAALVAAGTIALLMLAVWYGASAMRKSELAASNSQLQLQSLADFLPQLMWMANSKGWIYWYNQRWYEYTGTTFEEMQGWGWVKVHHPDHVDRVVSQVRQHWKMGEPWEETFPIRSQSGEWRWFLTRAHPVRDENTNEIKFWIGTNTDITEKLQTEDSLKQSKEEAEQANLAKSQFLANMSHEIRTPIGAIVGFSELLRDKTVPEASRECYMSVIERNSHHLLRLIDDILDISKIEAGQISIEREQMNLIDFVEDISTNMKHRAAERGIEFRLQVKGELPNEIDCDPLRLSQILTNLLNNSIKFTDRGYVELILSFAGDHLSMEVRDTGLGIAKAHQRELFKPFSQGDPTLSRRFGGTGLGLALTRRLCEEMGGYLVLKESTPGTGSTFEGNVLAPALSESRTSVFGNRSEQKRIHSSTLPKLSLPSCRILVVDDSADNRTLLEIYLRDTQAELIMAEDGEIGVRKALEINPDLILMDIQMPNLDGYAAVRILREKGFTKPIVALTAHAMRDEREKCIAAGYTEYLSKPIRRSQLLETVRKRCHEPLTQECGSDLQV
ncbi:MAG: response regulator [Bdellovibrionales bacterium]